MTPLNTIKLRERLDLRAVNPQVNARNRRQPNDPPGDREGVTSIRFSLTKDGLLWQGSYANGFRAKTTRRRDDSASTASMIHLAFEALMNGMSIRDVRNWFIGYGWTADKFVEYGFSPNELDRILHEALHDIPNGWRQSTYRL